MNNLPVAQRQYDNMAEDDSPAYRYAVAHDWAVETIIQDHELLTEAVLQTSMGGKHLQELFRLITRGDGQPPKHEVNKIMWALAQAYAGDYLEQKRVIV